MQYDRVFEKHRELRQKIHILRGLAFSCVYIVEVNLPVEIKMKHWLYDEALVPQSTPKFLVRSLRKSFIFNKLEPGFISPLESVTYNELSLVL